MELNSSQLNLIKTNSNQSKRLKALLANLYGFDVAIDLHTFIQTASESEWQCWLAIQTISYQTGFNSPQLTQLSQEIGLELASERAFEEGRSAAYALPPEQVAEYGLSWRYSKNPYTSQEGVAVEIEQAWKEGFQNAFEVITGESW